MAVFGLNSGQDSASDLEAFLNAFQISFPILRDDQGIYPQYRQSGGSSPYPLDYIIDQQGRVAYFNTEYDAEAMIEVIDDLLGQTSAHPDVPPVQPLLLHASPNPFNPRTEISYSLKRTQPVSLEILDARGYLVRTLLADESRPAGSGREFWDGKNNQGREMPSGLYLARIRTLDQTAVTKMTLVR